MAKNGWIDPADVKFEQPRKLFIKNAGAAQNQQRRNQLLFQNSKQIFKPIYGEESGPISKTHQNQEA